MYDQRLELMLPHAALREEFRAVVAEYRAAGESVDRFLEPVLDDFDEYLRQIAVFRQGQRVPRGYVPQTTYWSVLDGTTIVGLGRIRHELSPALFYEGGHIGYTVRPSFRGKGFGTRQCALLVEKTSAEYGFRRVLITCNEDNIASRRIIEANGGVYESTVVSRHSRKPVRRYWVRLEAR